MLFDNNWSKLLVSGVQSSKLNNRRGLLQGSSLSPILFNFFLDSLLKKLDRARDLKTITFGIYTNHLSFADDIALHATTMTKMHKLLKICEAWSTDTGMEFSPTKCMVLIPASTKSNLVPYKIYGNALTAAAKVTYLGIDFNAKGICWLGLVQRRRAKSSTIGVVKFKKNREKLS